MLLSDEIKGIKKIGGLPLDDMLDLADNVTDWKAKKERSLINTYYLYDGYVDDFYIHLKSYSHPYAFGLRRCSILVFANNNLIGYYQGHNKRLKTLLKETFPKIEEKTRQEDETSYRKNIQPYLNKIRKKSTTPSQKTPQKTTTKKKTKQKDFPKIWGKIPPEADKIIETLEEESRLRR